MNRSAAEREDIALLDKYLASDHGPENSMMIPDPPQGIRQSRQDR